MVSCSQCGSTSTELGRCLRCGRPVESVSLSIPATLSLSDGVPLDLSPWHGAWPLDCWRPRICWAGPIPYRVYAISRSWWPDLSHGINERAGIQLPVLPPVQVLPVGEAALVAVAALREGQPALRPASDDSLGAVLAECRTLAAVLDELTRVGLAWLTFDPTALEQQGSIVRITNLDLQLFWQGQPPENLAPSPRFSPPEVFHFRPDLIGPATEVFHLALYAYYRLAGLYPAGFPGGGLPSFDFEVPRLRIYRPNLPPGIAPVITTALSCEPNDRFPTVGDFLTELESAIVGADQRLRGKRPSTFQVGGLTITGQMKAARGQTNQDAFLLRSVPGADGPISLVVVADGVSLSRIGSGEIASETACEVLGEHLPDVVSQTQTLEELEAGLIACCIRASQAILERALALNGTEPPCEPADLMGTTILIGVVKDGVLTVACAGDSRAYLIAASEGRTQRLAEQLTVDGDVTCLELARGTAPEEVRALGDDALALYACLGVAEPGPSGEFECCLERVTPTIHHWPLLPGDVVVLCTDGLVEEGVFLEPSELVGLLAQHPEMSAQELAEQMVAQADARQRPDETETDGVGDNITCVVIKAS
jgi:serine/threonine protein phosphatase PrpC